MRPFSNYLCEEERNSLDAWEMFTERGPSDEVDSLLLLTAALKSTRPTDATGSLLLQGAADFLLLYVFKVVLSHPKSGAENQADSSPHIPTASL